MPKQLKLKKKQQKKIISFLTDRFSQLDRQREQFEKEIMEEIDVYNDIDKNMKKWNSTTKTGKHWWETAETIPYVYTIVQTMVARIIQIFFGRTNYLKIFVEDRNYKDVEREVRKWLQLELDKVHFKRRSRDFIEEALVQRTVWLQLRPVFMDDGKEKRKMDRVEFNILEFFDVWFDTRVTQVMDSDYFIRNIMPLWKLKQNEEYYMNLDEVVEKSALPEQYETEKAEEYEAKHSTSGEKDVSYYDPSYNDTTAEVEILEYYGVYDISDDPKKPDFKHVIFTLANRTVLVRAEEIKLETKRKFLLFPIRPMRQANSLIGKSPAQMTKSMQYLLNELVSQTLHNYKLAVNLMFKYKRDGDVDLGELYAGEGNAVGVENMEDVDLFPIPNLVEAGLTMVSWIIQFMQQTTGAVDYVMGTSAARGVTETASGIQTITQQAMFKFQMMAENIQGDLTDIVTYIMILWIKYNPEAILLKFPKLKEFINQTDRDLEEGRVLDIIMNDLALRRDTERTQFINASNILAQMISNVGGDLVKFTREVMEKLEMDGVDEILKSATNPADQQAAVQQLLAAAGQGAEENQKRGGGTKVAPNAENAATPEEEASNTTPKAEDTTT